jgi:hypothetical protein
MALVASYAFPRTTINTLILTNSRKKERKKRRRR